MSPRTHSNKPLIIVSMGDPSGIGPEVSLKALAKRYRRSKFHYCLVGDHAYLVRNTQKFKIPLPLAPVGHVRESKDLGPRVGVLDLKGAEKAKWGKVSAASGAAAVRYIQAAAKGALEGEAQALVTAPIHKEAIHKAGCPFPGHTELLAALSGTKVFAMMMVGGPIRITLQSIHVALKDSVSQVKPALVWEKLELTQKAMKDWFGYREPRIAVAGVNPHAGENGAFGKEEIKVLKPIIAKAQKKGWKVSGPHPPDTLFYAAAHGKYDAVLCMYHDQGLIPLKLTAFESGVNLTLGLPFVRTSPDHGTAFDIAGQGKADPSSMGSAMDLAEKLAQLAVSR